MHTHTPAAALVRLSDALEPDTRAMLDAIRYKSLPTVTRYRLTSTKLIHTPGLFAWLINAYQTDRHHAITVMNAGWPTVPADVRRGILDGSQPYTVNGSTVVIEVTR
jgi:hypothetical protein